MGGGELRRRGEGGKDSGGGGREGELILQLCAFVHRADPAGQGQQSKHQQWLGVKSGTVGVAGEEQGGGRGEGGREKGGGRAGEGH